MNRWSSQEANRWYASQPWLVGCNFIPSTAINQLEMWQADTFDPSTIDRELGFARGLGFNTLRVYLHDLAWEADAPGFKGRLDRFLQMTQTHGIRPILCIFDDCWNPKPRIGKQPEPVPGVHNSGWLQSPGAESVNDPQTWPRLERYVNDILGSFGADGRILMWDLYNEPGNSGQDERSLPLFNKVYEWAWRIRPAQPLTAGTFFGERENFNRVELAACDVTSFHNYGGADDLQRQITELRGLGRPLICTEWLRRGHSNVAECLPVFYRERVGCCNWGLVRGKTNTIWPWGSPQGAPEPALWFHDLLHADGSPFDAAEVALFRKLCPQKFIT
jgi:hypothetical protein